MATAIDPKAITRPSGGRTRNQLKPSLFQPVEKQLLPGALAQAKLDKLGLRCPQPKTDAAVFSNLAPERHGMVTFHACGPRESGRVAAAPAKPEIAPAADTWLQLRMEGCRHARSGRMCQSTLSKASPTAP